MSYNFGIVGSGLIADFHARTIDSGRFGNFIPGNAYIIKWFRNQE